MKTVIETHELCFSYRKQEVLRSINLEVPEGSVFGFLGVNGAGKSTTIRILLGLLSPQSGTVSILGKNVSADRELLRNVGSLIDFPSAYGHLSAYDNLKIVTTLLGLGNHRINETLAIVGLAGLHKKKVKSFSVGMKQRLGLALALVADAPILILDEPSNGLDPFGMAELRKLIVTLSTAHGKTIFISSHLLDEVEKVSTHIAILHKGSIRFQGKKEELLRVAPSVEESFFKLTSDAVA